MSSRKGEIPADPYRLRNIYYIPRRNGRHNENMGQVFAVKHTDLKLTAKRQNEVPILVFINMPCVPAFCDVDFSEYDLRVILESGYEIYAMDSQRHVWLMRLGEPNKTIYPLGGSGGTPEKAPQPEEE